MVKLNRGIIFGKQPFLFKERLFIDKITLMKRILLLSLLLITTFFTAQTYTLGSGTNSNGTTSYPTPYGNWYEGSKHQMLVLASELNSIGITAGDISSLAFNVENANGIALQNFTIRIKEVSRTSWNGSSEDFETGLTTVFSTISFTETNGWNTHAFSTPFTWDGVSNLLIETCFNNSSYTNNATVYYSSTSFNSVLYVRRDEQGVCSISQNDFNFFSSNNRPNMRFEWVAPNTPPVTDFTSSAVTSCSGTIGFLDQSSGNPTSWLWNFGDGSSSTLQNPIHTYTTSGTYSVSLIATNQFGNTTETKNNFISISLNAPTPIANSCIPITQDGSVGFGITNVTFNTINETTGDASEGYTDNTCSQTTVFAGQTYPISIEHSTPTFHNCAAWIDYNNNGVFEEPSERIITNSSTLTTTGNITISSVAVLNTPLRMRVSADYDLNAVPTPCTNLTYGQAEDYTIIVELDPNPPTAEFSVSSLMNCDGEVYFSDLSTNVPTSWSWDFGDGNNSIEQNPTHVYTSDGVYSVSLTVTNQFGSSTSTQTNLINVNFSDQLVAAQCMPQTLGHCCGYGIYSVDFNNGGIQNFTDGAEEGYQDYSCQYNDSVEGGLSYPFSIRTGSQNPQDTRIWVDFNNNGDFESSEQVFESLNAYNPSGNITIPPSGVVWDTALRMRVLSDEVGGSLDGCTDLTRGQVEDYYLKISESEVDISSVNELDEVLLSLYPNPTQNRVTIQSSGVAMSRVSVFNLIGKEIILINFNNNTLTSTIDLNNYADGTYLVQVGLVNGSTQLHKIIVSK